MRPPREPARELPLADRLAALREAVEVAEGRLEVPEVGRARALLAKAGARAALGDATVVALAGATGSGKSTLFNALSGGEVSTPGVRRPTTGVAHATRLGRRRTATDRLLDWLEVPRRHRHDARARRWTGWSCSTCPTTTASGWSTGWRWTGWSSWSTSWCGCSTRRSTPTPRCTTATWRRWPAHAGVLLVVLNQVDRLDAAAARACLADLRGLLDREGLAATPVAADLGPHRRRASPSCAASWPAGWPPGGRPPTGWRPTSARCGRTLAAHCAPDAGGGPAAGTAPTRDGLADALADAAGVPAVGRRGRALGRARGGTARTGWPLLRWTRRAAAPTRSSRLHLGDERARTSLPDGRRRADRPRWTTALRRARDAAGRGAAAGLAGRAAAHRGGVGGDAGRPAGPGGGRHRPRARPRRRCGSAAVGGLQWLLALVALAGALWLLGARRARASSARRRRAAAAGRRASRCRRCCWSAGCWPGCCWPLVAGRWCAPGPAGGPGPCGAG